MSLSQKRSVVGVDPGDNFAYCRVINGIPHDVGAWTWVQKRGMSPGARFLTFVPFFTNLLHRWQSDGPIEVVGIEQMFHRGGYASDVLKGYELNAQTVCAKLKIEHIPAPISAVKKYATGNGRASKAAMRTFLEVVKGRS